jgi:hypothetical protein
MMTTDTVDRFVQAFRGRGDAHGSWAGGAVKQPVTRRVFEQHLTDGPHIGIYPLISTRTSWGCVDIDGKDFNHDWDAMWTLADNLRTVLSVKHVYAHQERTANGIHLWVFPDTPLVPAAHMRRALMAACTVIGYNPKEVNPKQEDDRGGLGNYVRLPYYGALANGTPPDRHFVSEDKDAIDLDNALNTVEQNRTSAAALEELSALWAPPAPRTFTINADTDTDASVFVTLMSGKAYKIWQEGPLPGADRSGTLVRLAAALVASDLPSHVSFQLLKAADQRWGKYHLRADCDEQLARILERVTP